MPTRPLLVFDVNETLLDLEVMSPIFQWHARARWLSTDARCDRPIPDGALPAGRRSRRQIERGLFRQFAEFVGGKSIDRGSKLDMVLDVGLQSQPGRSLPSVTEPNCQRVAGTEVAADDAYEQRIAIGANIEAIEPDLEFGAVAGLNRCKIWRFRFAKLRFAEVGRGPPGHLHHAGVVDSKCSGSVDKNELGIRSGDKWPRC